MAHATPTDVAAELGRSAESLTPEEKIQFESWLSRVEAMVKTRITDLDARTTTDTAYRELVVSIEAAAVARRALNWEGYRSVTRAVDDGSVTKVRDTTLSDGQLRITDEEWSLLTPVRTSGAFSIRPAYAAGRRW